MLDNIGYDYEGKMEVPLTQSLPLTIDNGPTMPLACRLGLRTVGVAQWRERAL